jgi:hypothetical protein
MARPRSEYPAGHYQGVRAVLLAIWFLCAVGAVTLG